MARWVMVILLAACGHAPATAREGAPVVMPRAEDTTPPPPPRVVADPGAPRAWIPARIVNVRIVGGGTFVTAAIGTDAHRIDMQTKCRLGRATEDRCHLVGIASQSVDAQLALTPDQIRASAAMELFAAP